MALVTIRGVLADRLPVARECMRRGFGQRRCGGVASGVGDMNNERFDQLTKTLSKTASRRTVFKGMVAAAVGGACTRLRGGDSAAARARVRMACARLGQPCATGTGTRGNMLCCPDVTCGAE